MNTYRVQIVLDVAIEAPNIEDAKEIVDDYFGRGCGGEGVNVTDVSVAIK